MTISEKVPGMKPGSTIRNVGVGVVYLFVIFAILGALGGGSDTDAAPNSDASAAPAATEVEAAPPVDVEPDEVEATPVPVEQPSEADGMSTDAEARSEYTSRIQHHFSNEGSRVKVGSVQSSGSDWSLRYESFATTEEELMNEIAVFIGGYAGLANREDIDPPESMQVTLVNGYNGDVAGTWHVDTTWANAYSDETLSGEEYILRVLGTLKESA